MNEERALVLYQPMLMSKPVAHAHLLAVAGPHPNPCNPSFSIASPHLIPALIVRGQIASNDAVVTNEEESLAVVPWAPNKLNWDQSQEEELCSMETEEEMELEDEGEREEKLVIVNENSEHHHQQWQWLQNHNHKHCMAAPQFPLNSVLLQLP